MKIFHITIALVVCSKTLWCEIQSPPTDVASEESTADAGAEEQTVEASAQTAEAMPQQIASPAGIPPATTATISWPDTITFEENSPDLNPSDNPAVVTLFQKSIKLTDALGNALPEMSKKRKAFYEQYFDLNTQINQFYQEVLVSEAEQHSSDERAANTKNNNTQIIRESIEALKKDLELIDEIITKAENLFIDAQKNALMILQQSSEAEAEKIYLKIESYSKEFQEKNDLINNKHSKAFEAKHNEIKALLETSKLSTNQAIAIPKPQVEIEQQQKLLTNPVTEGKDANKANDVIQTNNHQSFVHYLRNRIFDIAKDAASIIVSTYQKTRDVVMKKINNTDAQEQKNTESTEDKSHSNTQNSAENKDIGRDKTLSSPSPNNIQQPQTTP